MHRVRCAARIGRNWYSQSTIHRRSLPARLPSRGRESANCTLARWNYSSPSSETCSTPVVSRWDPRNLRTHLRSRNAVWEKRERFWPACSAPCDRSKGAIAASRSPAGFLQDEMSGSASRLEPEPAPRLPIPARPSCFAGAGAIMARYQCRLHLWRIIP